MVCLGWHRTGTTSLHLALDHLGYRVVDVRPDLIRDLQWGRDRAIWRQVRHADAFRDFPWSILWKEFDLRHPNSRYILTVRDPDEWLASYRKHFALVGDKGVHSWLYGEKCPAERGEFFLERFVNHEREVRAFFSQRSDLLVMNLFAGDGWDLLAPFLEVPSPPEPFPHEKSRTLGP